MPVDAAGDFGLHVLRNLCQKRQPTLNFSVNHYACMILST